MINDIDAIINDAKILLNNSDKAHDFSHVERVMNNAVFIANQVDVPFDIDVLKLIAILHDVDDYKIFPVYKNNAMNIMKKHNIDDDVSDLVVESIGDISFSKGSVPKTIEGKIVQDADRLDAIGAIGIARVFTYGGRNDIPIYDTTCYCSIQHFYDKLLKLSQQMNFDASREIANARTKIMEDYLNAFFSEISPN